MKIKSVKAKNFRTLQDFNISFDHTYCAISGKNNCGKSAIFKILQHFLIKDARDSILFMHEDISYEQDLTKWLPSENKEKIEIQADLEISDEKDPEIFFSINSYAGSLVKGKKINLSLYQEFSSAGESKLICKIDKSIVEDRPAIEILKKLKSSNALIFYNSISPGRSFLFGGQGILEVVEAHFSADDLKKITAAKKSLQTRIKSATKAHKGEIDKLLGKLNDKYQVELSAVDGSKNSSYSLEVRLADKSVDVPLKDWGAGTQNRTRLLMTLLEAIRKKTNSNDQEKLSPVLLVEEPESFLHPSAQSDFGYVLSSLSEEHDIQMIVNTHSPYLLNVKKPEANILLDRKKFRTSLKETCIVPTSGDKWMLPFSKILGVVPEDFDGWSQIFGAKFGKIILVEGIIDVEYFEFFKNNHPDIYQISSDVEILPYNGKDALKNTQILKFMLSRMDKSFITFDLDVKEEVQKKLEAIDLVEDVDFCSVGKNEAGGGCIEGLVPKQIKAKVFSENVEIVQALTSANTREKNEARNKIKSKMLDETKKMSLSDKDFSDFKKFFSKIQKAFKQKE